MKNLPTSSNKIIEKVSSNKSLSDPSFQVEEQKDGSATKLNLSKFDYELYHDEDNVVQKVIRVKRVSLPNNEDSWKIFEDKKVLFVIEGSKCTKKEREFLKTIDGFNWLLALAKTEIKSFNQFKIELKKKLSA